MGGGSAGCRESGEAKTALACDECDFQRIRGQEGYSARIIRCHCTLEFSKEDVYLLGIVDARERERVPVVLLRRHD